MYTFILSSPLAYELDKTPTRRAPQRRAMKITKMFIAATLTTALPRVWGIDKSTTPDLQEMKPAKTNTYRRMQSDRDPHIAIRKGVLFQDGGCPQAISSEEADARLADTTSEGNIIRLTEQSHGRTGNRFENVSQHLARGYCCKSKLLELPVEDDEMPVEKGQEFNPTRRWFDFSDADVMPISEFDDLSGRPDVCKPLVEVGGGDSFGLKDVHPDLLRCINRVFLRGCEAEYLGSLGNIASLCERASPSTPSLKVENPTTNDVTPAMEEATCQNNILHGEEPGENTKGGILAVHMRSGDIFRRSRPSFENAGQPPLEFFLKAIKSRQWSEVYIITYAKRNRELNPTYTALEAMKQQGQLGPNVYTFKDRPLVEDFRTMVCADALAMSRSSLHFMTTALSRASTFFVPSECGPGNYKRGPKEGPHPKTALDNTTLLQLEKPHAEVYGMGWQLGQESYSPYTKWDKTRQQLQEMIEFDAIELERCCV